MSDVNFIEALESRRLLSADPGTIALSAAVQADHLQIRADLLKFNSDLLSCHATLQAGVSLLKADNLKSAKTVAAPIAKFRADIKSTESTLRADRLAERRNVLNDEILIVGVLQKILKDKGNTTALAADHAQLLTDRIQLQTDAIGGLNARLNTRTGAFSTLFNDLAAIVTAVGTDPNASAKLKADVSTWSADRTHCMTTLTADIQALIADRTQLVADLTAMQSA